MGDDGEDTEVRHVNSETKELLTGFLLYTVLPLLVVVGLAVFLFIRWMQKRGQP